MSRGPAGLSVLHRAARTGDGPWFTFSTTYSLADLKPGWYAPYRGLAADTLGFEVGPFYYDVAMRGLVNLDNGVIYPDATPDRLEFQGNFPPCIQAVDIVNLDHDPADLAATADCWEDDSLVEVTALTIYSQSDPRYRPAEDPDQLSLFDPSSFIWIDPDARRVSIHEPSDPADWRAVPAVHYRSVIYLHGRDHLREFPPADRMEERIKAWRYQIDHVADPDNLLREGPGPDDIDLLYGFDLQQNDPDAIHSEEFITQDGVWGLALDVKAPRFLQDQGPEVYWAFLQAVNAAPPRPDDPADWPAWQEDPAVQRAYTSWQLTTMAFGDGSLQLVAADQSTCDWRRETSTYHYYAKTRIPDPNGRRCEDNAYDNPEQGIFELSNLDLGEFVLSSDSGQPLVKPLSITLGLLDGSDFEEGDPPGWISDLVLDISTARSR